MAALVAAREAKLQEMADSFPAQDAVESNNNVFEGIHGTKLVAYCSDQAHVCAEKGAKIAMVKIRVLKSQSDGTLCSEALHKVRKLRHKCERYLPSVHLILKGDEKRLGSGTGSILRHGHAWNDELLRIR